MPEVPSIIDSLQPFEQEIATLEGLLNLIEKLPPADEKDATVSLSVLTSMATKLETFYKKEPEKSESLTKRVQEAGVKLLELCTAIPAVHEHLTSAQIQEKLEYVDERLQITTQAFGLIMLYPAQANAAGIRTLEHRKALVDVLGDPEVQPCPCGLIQAKKNPLSKRNEQKNCALDFLVRILKTQKELLPEGKLREEFVNRSMKDWLSHTRSFALNAYEAAFLFSEGKIEKEDISEKLQENRLATDDDWRMSPSTEIIHQLSTVNATLFKEAESIARDVLKKNFPNIEKKTDEKEDSRDIVGTLLKILMFLGPPAGYLVSIMRLNTHTNLMKEFRELSPLLTNEDLNYKEISKRVEKLAKKLQLKPSDVRAMAQSNKFMTEIVGNVFMNKPDGKIKTILSLFNVYPFPLRYRGPHAQISLHRFRTVVVPFLKKCKIPQPSPHTERDLLTQRSAVDILNYLSDHTIKVKLDGTIDPGNGMKPIRIPLKR